MEIPFEPSFWRPPYAGRPGWTWRKKRCLGEGGVTCIRNLTVSPSHWHPCAEISSDLSDARDMAPPSPVHGHCWECILSLTQSNGRFFLLPKPWLHLSTGSSSLTPVKGESLGLWQQRRRHRLLSAGGFRVCPVLVPVCPISLHNGWDPKAMASQRDPSPVAPTTKATFQKFLRSVELRQGSTAGAGDSGGGTWRQKRELGSKERGGDVRMHKRRHRKGYSSRNRTGLGTTFEGKGSLQGNLGRALCLLGPTLEQGHTWMDSSPWLTQDGEGY